jgi:hypothetical protein
MLQQIENLQIFSPEEPQKPDWESLKKAKSSLEYFINSSALYQVHSLIEMVEMCRSVDNITDINNDILSITSRKFLTLKHLVNHKVSSTNWIERISLKYKAIVQAYEVIQRKSESIKKNNYNQKAFMRILLNISKRWKIVQQGNSIFALIGKKNQNEDYKALILKDPERIIRVELSPEINKLKILVVEVTCDKIVLPEVKLLKTIEFNDLERAEQLIIDADIMKEVQDKIGDRKEYVVHKYTKQEINFIVNVIFI